MRTSSGWKRRFERYRLTAGSADATERCSCCHIMPGSHTGTSPGSPGWMSAIGDGSAIINTRGGPLMLHLVSDGRLCGPCGLARWVHVLDLTVSPFRPGGDHLIARPLSALNRRPRHTCVRATLRAPTSPRVCCSRRSIRGGTSGSIQARPARTASAMPTTSTISSSERGNSSVAGQLLDDPGTTTAHPGRVKVSP